MAGGAIPAVMCSIFDFARIRAIRNPPVAVVRSANNGISGMIGPKGEVLARTDYWVRTALVLDVPVYERETMYTPPGYGDWIGWFSLGLCVLGIIWMPVYRKSSNFIVD